MEALSLRRQDSLSRIVIMKPVAQYTSDAGQKTAISSHVPATQGKHILWVGIRASEFGLLGEKVHYSPRVTSRKWNCVKEKLRQFVNGDMQKAPSERIDSILLYPGFSLTNRRRSCGTTFSEAFGVSRLRL